MKRKLTLGSADEQKGSRIQAYSNGYGFSRPSGSSGYSDAGYPTFSSLDGNGIQDLAGYRGYPTPLPPRDPIRRYVPSARVRGAPVEFYPPYPYDLPVQENQVYSEQVRPARYNVGLPPNGLNSRRQRPRPFGPYYEMPAPYQYEHYNHAMRPFFDRGWGDMQYSGRNGYGNGNHPHYAPMPHMSNSSSARDTEYEYPYHYANGARPHFPPPYPYHPELRPSARDTHQEVNVNVASTSSRMNFDNQQNFTTFRSEQEDERDDVEKDKRKQRRVCIIENCTKIAQGITRCCTKHGGGKRCLTVNCSKGAVGSTSYCVAHGGGKRCTQEGCKKSAIPMYSFCFSHGGGKRCAREGCTKGARATTSFCIAHGGGKRCSIPGCSKSDQGSGFCIAHGGGRRRKRDGSSE